ncbi:WhiB family transcriptional regulator [Nocardia sp. CA2R105]|uniref:WhiB family transcriptional regulator n=1 Tax=Nocardia coffeae TaxID=2873381 RepID=UPI001CA73F87|nr:WhiB family transcriptional regulator [Nocardia coffeae]MBY8862787.1 WhiB family transcriptional regulator [Nocardia coffeae]
MLAAFPDVARYYPSTSEAWEWQLDGHCRGVDSEVFFHPDGERGRARIERAYLAKRICHSCPVLDRCREYALAVGEPFGVWGGMTEEERRTFLENSRTSRSRTEHRTPHSGYRTSWGRVPLA